MVKKQEIEKKISNNGIFDKIKSIIKNNNGLIFHVGEMGIRLGAANILDNQGCDVASTYLRSTAIAESIYNSMRAYYFFMKHYDIKYLLPHNPINPRLKTTIEKVLLYDLEKFVEEACQEYIPIIKERLSR